MAKAKRQTKKTGRGVSKPARTKPARKVAGKARKAAKPARKAAAAPAPRKPAAALRKPAVRTARKAVAQAARPAAVAAPRPVAEPAPRVVTSVPFILLVEDFTDAREMYAEYFRFLGHRVETAENGVEAIEKATCLLPDVILMDLSLPVLDGWEATRRLKKDERTHAIPIIALTGNALQGHEERAMEAGCDAFLAKPCLPEVVEQEVKKFLALRAGAA